MTQQANWQEIKFTDADVVNPHEYDSNRSTGYFKAWLIHDHGFTLAIVFASCEQDALDAAADDGKLDRARVEHDDLFTMTPAEAERLHYLGNCGVAYDLDTIGVILLPNPPFSFVALFNAMNKEK